MSATLIPLTNDTASTPGSELRSVAGKLLALADLVDRDGEVEESKAVIALSERDQLMLRIWAEAEYRGRRKRADFIAEDLLGEPAWDTLLYLYTQHARGKSASVTSVCKAAAVSDTGARRCLWNLEQEQLVARLPGSPDNGAETVQLTETGVQAVANWLRYRAALPA